MRPVLLLAAGAALLAGCGGTAGPPPAPVQLQVTAPDDEVVVREASVELRGRVRPSGARVTVRGRDAPVSGGEFAIRVALAGGTNVIDVLATDGRARPAVTAVRVRREITVTVPDVGGLSGDDAESQLTALGLEAERKNAGGVLDDFFGGDPVVCTTEPSAGDDVDAGSTVTLRISRRC